MSRNAQLIGERLRAALRFHTSRRHGRPLEQVPSRRAGTRSHPAAATAPTPGEEFARRLRAAIDA